MATIVLSAIGTVIAGPIGGAIGATIGSYVDRAVLAPHTRQEGPRLNDLAVQSSAYGDALPLLYGRVRISGNVFWSTGLTEHRSEMRRKVGGKTGGSTTTTTYAYTASFAVGLSTRPIVALGRIWADGKLIRDQSGQLTVGGRLRLYQGSERQEADALMEAALGASSAPAHRGMAYVVFEDLALAEFANRIPALSFEVFADEGAAINVGDIAHDLARRCGLTTEVPQVVANLAGFAVARTTTARAVLETLATVSPLGVIDDGRALRFSDVGDNRTTLPLERDMGAAPEGEKKVRQKRQRSRASISPREVSLLYLESARDYQPGLQRARRLTSASAAVERRELSATLESAAAKQIAEQLLARLWDEREQLTLRLPWRYLGLTPGDRITLESSPEQVWRIDEVTLEAGAVEIALTPLAPSGQIFPVQGEAGQAPSQEGRPHGPTQIAVLDLPTLGQSSTSGPALHLAVAGANAGWRRASVYASFDQGQLYEPIADFAAQTLMGVVNAPLAAGAASVWDRTNSLVVDLLNPDMTLESRSEASVLAGANLCLIGGELIQFAQAEALVPGRYRLSTLLRGRRGTEAMISTHGANEALILLTGSALAVVDGPTIGLGQTLLFKALSPYQSLGEGVEQSAVVTGRALMPLSPVHLRAVKLANGNVALSWIRRSRIGFDWVDGVDAPLGEEAERYLLRIRRQGGIVREQLTPTPAFLYALADQVVDFGAPISLLDVSVQQISALVGPGAENRSAFSF